MKVTSILTTTLVLAALCASPVSADPRDGKGHGNKRMQMHDSRPYDRGGNSYVAHCPPGLAKKNPPCVPPGQAKNYYGNRVGDTLRIGDYTIIRDPRRYDLEQRRGWDYYRDDNRIYRVDSGTRKVLAVLELIDAFTN